MTTTRPHQLTPFVHQTVRAFNLAALCALGIWHGYMFYVNQAIAKLPPSPSIEFKLIQSSTLTTNSTTADTNKEQQS